MYPYLFKNKKFIMIEEDEYNELQRLKYAKDYSKIIDEAHHKANKLLKITYSSYDNTQGMFTILSKEEADVLAHKDYKRIAEKVSSQEYQIKSLKEEINKIKNSFWYFLVK